jgi:hypothetical protein
MKRYRQSQPSKLVIASIIFGIITFAVGIVVICVVIHVRRGNGKHKTPDT